MKSTFRLSILAWSLAGLVAVQMAFAADPSLKLLRQPGQEVVGTDQGKGNIVALSPYLEPQDFESQEAFAAKWDAYFSVLKSEGWISPDRKTVVALPELASMYLFLMDQGSLADLHVPLLIKGIASLAKLGDFETKLLTIAIYRYHLPSPGAGGALNGVPGEWMDKIAANVTRRLIQARAQDMADAYNNTFSALARKYGVTIFAGSIALPDPQVVTTSPGITSIRVTPGAELFNTLFAFAPDGHILQSVRKVHVPGGEGFDAESTLDQVQPIQTEIGAGGALICADSWFKDTWASLVGAQFVIVPQYADTAFSEASEWPGYSLAKIPHRLTAAEATELAGITDQAKYLRDTSMDPTQGGISEHRALVEYTSPFWAPQFQIPISIVIPNRAQMLDKGSDNGLIITSPALADPTAQTDFLAAGASVVKSQIAGAPPILVRSAPVEASATIANVYLQ